LARIYIFGRLRSASVMIADSGRSRTMLTERSTPIPEKTTFAGDNI
jgi:hypothetical protein